MVPNLKILAWATTKVLEAPTQFGTCPTSI